MIEKHSATWEHIVSRIGEESESIRNQLELESTDELRTTRLRARIRAFKDVLTWVDAAPDESNEGPNAPWQI